MQLGDLQELIREANKSFFKELGVKPLNADNEYVSRIFERRAAPGTGCSGDFVAEPCFCGKLREQSVTAVDYSKYLYLQDLSGNTGRVAVGAVIDTPETNNPDDRSVVVAVGINYGQGPVYLNPSHVPLCGKNNTEMRAKLDSVFDILRNSDRCGGARETLPDREQGYYLVALNIFPWITTISWSQLFTNCIEEALFINCFSGIDSAKFLKRILDGLASKGLRSLVFHGANNAVPYWGTEFVNSGSFSSADRFGVIFCDNLAKGQRQVASNAVLLCNRDLHKGVIHNLDYDS